MQIILAPLQGVTEYPFRNAWSSFFSGLDSAYSPFIPCVTGARVKPAHIRDVLPENNSNNLTLVPQLLGNNAGQMKLMIEALAGYGYTEVNWNMGCPSSTVVKRVRGCGLMQYPERVESILEELMPGLPVNLSVKLRLGVKSVDEMAQVLQVLNRFPLLKIILHPRLGIQQYSGQPDHSAFNNALGISLHPLVYNGDINSKWDYTKLMERFPGLSEIMIGRGVLMNPFLPESIKWGRVPVIKDAMDILYRFNEFLIQSLCKIKPSQKRAVSGVKEHWHYFSFWFEDRKKVWYNVSHAVDMAEIRFAIDNAFKGNLNERLIS